MKLISVAAVALNQTPLDWENNKRNIINAIHKAKNLKASIICLPELCITGYGCEDAFFYPSVQDQALSILDEIRLETENIIVSVGLPLNWNNALYNVAALIVDKRIVGYVPKQNLAADGVHYEPRWFKPWPRDYVGITQALEYDNFIGDIIFNVGDIKIGYEICEDAWVADRPGAQLAKRGTDIILNPSASHFALGKRPIREQFVTEGSRAFRCVYVYANLLGNEAGRLIFDGDTIIGSGGRIVAFGPRFTFGDHNITVASVDIEKNRTLQTQTGSFRPDISHQKQQVNIQFEYPDGGVTPFDKHIDFEGSACGIDNSNTEFRFAVALGLFDYMRKSHSKGFVLSLSGGADSAAVACLVRSMRDLAVSALGSGGFEKRTGVTPDMEKLLTCIYQKSENSSDDTEKAAVQLAMELGAKMLVTDIDPIVKEYVKIGEEHMGRKLTWKQDDIPLQNIQARVRAPSAWLLANLNNALLLCTSNRSESAVGYCSADGDTSGGLSPIAGIDKTFLRHWLVWLSDQKIYRRALKRVNSLTPTAELRPQGSSQTDEEDLMPYHVLNTIEQMAIRDKKDPQKVYEHLCRMGIAKKFAAKWTRKFFTLWFQNQWKREKFAVAFHLDNHNLDPKTWCRFPVLNSGFRSELESLK